MKKVKQVNIVFMMSALMPLIYMEFLHFTGLRVRSSLATIFISVLVFALPAIVYLIVTKTNLKNAIRIKKVSICNVFLLILFAFLIMPGMTVINGISLLFSKNLIQQEAANITSNYPLVVGVFAMAVMPAIFEETVYRGVLYNEYRKVNPKAAVFLSALLFGLLHMNLNQFSYAFVLGIVFALVIEATDSIISTMIIHFIINASSVVTSFLLPKFYRLLEQLYGKDMFNAEELLKQAGDVTDKVALIQSIEMLIVPAIIASVLAFLVYRTIAKNENRYELVKGIFHNTSEHESAVHMFSIPLIIGMLYCVYQIILNLIM